MSSKILEKPVVDISDNPKYRREIRSVVMGVKESHFVLCNLLQSATEAAVYTCKIIDESLHGFGCLLTGDSAPKIGQILDYCGLGKYEVRWLNQNNDEVRFGLMKIQA